MITIYYLTCKQVTAQVSPLTYRRAAKHAKIALDMLLKLDSWTRRGLSEAKLRRLFARCSCGLIMTRRIFKDHVCALAPVVIDFTSDDDK